MGNDHRITPHDAAELAACFRAHASRLFGHACVLARGDRALADDLVQATFEAAARVWQTLRVWPKSSSGVGCGARWPTSRPAASAARPRSSTGCRRSRQAIAVPGRPFGASPSEQALSAIALDRCWRIIREMPKGQHVVAVLRWQLGMKEAEIATVLGIAESTVSAQCTGRDVS